MIRTTFTRPPDGEGGTRDPAAQLILDTLSLVGASDLSAGDHPLPILHELPEDGEPPAHYLTRVWSRHLPLRCVHDEWWSFRVDFGWTAEEIAEIIDLLRAVEVSQPCLLELQTATLAVWESLLAPDEEK